MKTNIALVGFMGAGKTSVGKALAKKLGKSFIEVDELIKKKVNKSIQEIFDESGEIRFRELEIETIKEVAEMENAVISCGGGAVLNKINIDRLRKSSSIVLLTAPLGPIEKTSDRPLLNNSDIGALLKFREPFYKAAADITVDTAELSTEEVVDKIIEKLSI